MGGLAAGSFYVAFRGVRNWSWETYWLVGGAFSWLLAPWALGLALTEDLAGVLARTPGSVLLWTWLFGFLWGLGGLTFGLAMRYLGVSLGYGIALGICAVCGTLLPPIVKGTLSEIAANSAGRITLLGIGVCVVGILLTSLAGWSKEREMPPEKKQESVKEFSFRTGIVVALFCGVLSACMAFALDSATPIAELSAQAGTPAIWTGLPKLVVVLLGGFTSNAVWCVALNIRNKSFAEYVSRRTPRGEFVPFLGNLGFCALAGITWYLQFFFYTMGETQMGRFGFSSWTLHMASIIIFSMVWGLALKEWRGASRWTLGLAASGTAILILSTIVVGYGNFVATGR